MKIVLLTLLPLVFLGQSQKTTYWIPKKYVDSLVVSGTNNKYEKYIKPIQAIVNKNGKWYIETYGGMLQPLIQVSNSKVNKIQIKELSLNLNIFSEKEQDSISRIKYVIKPYKDSLILEAYNGSVLLEEKIYIKGFRNYKFEQLGKTRQILLLQGKYHIYNFSGEKPKVAIEISPNGYVYGGEVLSSCLFTRVLIPDENHNFYNLVEFHLRDKTIKKLAIIYNEKERKWIGYEYEVINSYAIRALPKPIFYMLKI